MSPSSSLSSPWAQGSSLPNTLPAAFPTSELGVEELQVLSWNGRGIFLANSAKRKLKGAQLVKLACKAHVLCLQEVHGLEADVEHSISLLLPGWKVLYSPSVHRDGTFDPHSGGVATLICPRLAAVANFGREFVVPGRCLVTSLKVRNKCLSVCNIHNFGLSISDIRAIKDFLFMLRSSIELNPTSMLGSLVGDVNIKAEHERSFKIGHNFAGGLRDRGFGNPLFTGQRLGQWRPILSSWTENIQPMPTHFDFAAQSCSRIDRVWAFGPSLSLIHI